MHYLISDPQVLPLILLIICLRTRGCGGCDHPTRAVKLRSRHTLSAQTAARSKLPQLNARCVETPLPHGRRARGLVLERDEASGT
eukprot:1178695-Prorocentrum_minimum.AAC.4